MTETESRIEYSPPKRGTWRDEGRFTISGVSDRGIRTYHLFEEMTLPMNQDQLSEFYKREKQAGNPVPANARLLWAIAQRSYELCPTEHGNRLRDFLRAGFRRFASTLTRIDYSLEGDSVLHNVGTSDEYILRGNFAGSDGWISQIRCKNILEAVFGTQDVEQINRFSYWIDGTDAYIYREKRSNQPIKSAVWLGASDSRLNLGCGLLCNEFPAFRVLQVE